MVQVNGRVGAFAKVDSAKKVAEFLGYGVYEGDFVPGDAKGFLAEISKRAGIPNPRIRLDSGKVVWGCECWWEPEEIAKRHVEEYKKDGFAVNVADIDAYRARATGADECDACDRAGW